MISVIKKEMPYICTKRVGKMFVFLIVILCLSVEWCTSISISKSKCFVVNPGEFWDRAWDTDACGYTPANRREQSRVSSLSSITSYPTEAAGTPHRAHICGLWEFHLLPLQCCVHSSTRLTATHAWAWPGCKTIWLFSMQSAVLFPCRVGQPQLQSPWRRCSCYGKSLSITRWCRHGKQGENLL